MNHSYPNGSNGGTHLSDDEDLILRRVPEFVGQYQKLKDEMEAARKREVAEVIDYIVKLIALYELSIDDIAGAHSGKHPVRRRKARYMDPVSGKTWSGRGRRPLWMKGREPDEFLMPTDAE
ncbi:H-NS histone family protein [Burkholderia contaminans]|uniref:H-NS histone family protein n=1 Tax=Burkholderia contaminans TaxID=488447 RepID=UPI0024172ED4|nr:H-NS histone family protein [Burkholderia contaminans]WFN14438.1 H-NS histone family protein [Burkholderia contaminans]WFN14847.1 H-NS histone family protein [Burkholderia contaminans]WFN14895.1 H-NS histone family protein [Burkholderia contaminans]